MNRPNKNSQCFSPGTPALDYFLDLQHLSQTSSIEYALTKVRTCHHRLTSNSCLTTAFLNNNYYLGQERFSSMTRVYYKGAAACVIMFDLTSQQTFNSTVKWKKDLDTKCTLPNGQTIPCILVGNKSDLSTRPVEKDMIDKMCHENGFLGWTEMSVKEDINVTETME
ncbi:PREDICTED: ras-related protein Rab-7L1-like [Acropora digitifera]|uniref:ras-related protein Rab-7L1-like n=1 Tax=Acropora digitifera TaxID=70779 RepID=UPI00077A50A1|nr:PREDICTED: ras-related protein Rab-7L1-like [Acropora digitifera]